MQGWLQLGGVTTKQQRGSRWCEVGAACQPTGRVWPGTSVWLPPSPYYRLLLQLHRPPDWMQPENRKSSSATGARASAMCAGGSGCKPVQPAERRRRVLLNYTGGVYVSLHRGAALLQLPSPMLRSPLCSCCCLSRGQEGGRGRGWEWNEHTFACVPILC